ncbi:MAG: polyprenyl synthetase family protein, partial [Firmicutes bacterium]|nr:polyprenyl synthetase family protein [Bacillota bacterium]
MTNHLGLESTGETYTVAEALQLSKQLMDQALATTPAVFRPRTEYLTKAHGKFLRAQALLVCAQDETGVKLSAAKAAAAVELLHLATLVHDDVMDNAETRRSQPTLFKKFGARQAVITGDYIFCLALRLAAQAASEQIKPEDDIPFLMEKICMGELLQTIHQRDFGLAGIGYLRIISGKTAALFEGSFHTGAMLNEQSRDKAKEYASIGWLLGMVFQLADDCIDYEATVEQALKPVLSDFEQGVITLPLIVAMQKQPELKQLAANGAMTKLEVQQAVQRHGGIRFTRRVARLYYDRAVRKLDALDAPLFQKEQIGLLLKQAGKA